MKSATPTRPSPTPAEARAYGKWVADDDAAYGKQEPNYAHAPSATATIHTQSASTQMQI